MWEVTGHRIYSFGCLVHFHERNQSFHNLILREVFSEGHGLECNVCDKHDEEEDYKHLILGMVVNCLGTWWRGRLEITDFVYLADPFCQFNPIKQTVTF